MTVNVAPLQVAFINDDVIVGAGNNAVSISNNDTIVVGRDANIFSPNDGIYFNDIVASQIGQIQNNGFIYGNYAIYINNMVGHEDLSNAPGATIEGQQIGIYASPNSTRITLNNSGYIYGTDDGVAFLGSNSEIVNSGSIECSPDWRDDNLFKTNNYDDFYAINLQTASDNIITNAASGIISGAGGIYSSGYSNSLFNDGSIEAADNYRAVSLGGSSSYVSNTGSISSGSIALLLQGGSDTLVNSGVISTSSQYAAWLDGDYCIVHNSGEITAGDVDAIDMSGSGDFVENSGKLTASTQAVVFNGVSDNLVNSGAITATKWAVYSVGDNASIDNSGDMEALDYAIEMDGNAAVLLNSGKIRSTGDRSIFVDGENATIRNSGTISSGADDIYITGATSAYDWIVNALGGVIEAADDAAYAINVTGSPVHIVNHGEIIGSTSAGGASTFLNTGDYSGKVTLSGSGGVTVRNSGHMSYEGAGAAGDAGVVMGGGALADVFVNAVGGVIDASNAASLYFSGGGTLRAYNYGEMFGGLSLLGQTSLVNTGEITGDVDFTVAGALLVNRGLIDGNVFFAGTGNVYRGQSGVVSGAIVGAGADGRYFGGADDDTFAMTASGAAYVSGGAGDDTFIFSAAGLKASTTVVGGDGLDTLIFSTASVFASSAFAHVSGIEAIDLASGANTLTLTNALVNSASQGALTVYGGSAHDTISDAAVTNAADVVTVYGGGGADSITAGGARDIFAYASKQDSTGPNFDTIANANLGVDRFDVSAAAGSILAINAAVTTGTLSTATFNTDLVSDLPAASLGAHDAVLFTASAGSFVGATFLVVDVNGVAGYQSNADLVIRLTGATGTLTTADFL